MNLPTRIGNPIKFCAVAPKSSKVACVTFKFSIATSSIDIPVLRGKKENNYWPIKEDETCGHKKKHLPYLDGKQSIGQ